MPIPTCSSSSFWFPTWAGCCATVSRTGRGVLERRGCSALCWQGSESMRYAVLLLVGLLLAACSPEDTTVTPSPSQTQAPTTPPSATQSATEPQAVHAQRPAIHVPHPTAPNPRDRD